MLDADVQAEGGPLSGPVGAVGAGVGLLPRVGHVVVAEIPLVVELFEAHRAAVFHVGLGRF